MKGCNMDCEHCPYPDCIKEDARAMYPSWVYENRSDEYKQKQKERVKAWREEHKRLGLCVQCSRKAVEGKVLCAEHALRRKRYYREMCDRLKEVSND